MELFEERETVRQREEVVDRTTVGGTAVKDMQDPEGPPLGRGDQLCPRR